MFFVSGCITYPGAGGLFHRDITWTKPGTTDQDIARDSYQYANESGGGTSVGLGAKRARPTSNGSLGMLPSSSLWILMASGFQWEIRPQSTAWTTRVVAKW
jgi:hypothetical protein